MYTWNLAGYRHGHAPGGLGTRRGHIRCSSGCVELHRYVPGPEVGRYVERYWTVRWDLPADQRHDVQVITHPCVNVAFLDGAGAHVHGLVTRTFTQHVAGTGRVFGVKFRPGGFHTYDAGPVSALTDRVVGLSEVFGPDAATLTDMVLGAATDEQRAALVETFLRGWLPDTPDPTYDLVLRMVATMLEDRTVTRVDQVATRYGMSRRTLQRLFRRYVGVGPKWVIRRYRLHDAAELMAAGAVRDPAGLAVELGWFDQAHFTRDFTALIGTSPVEYAAQCAADAI